MTPFFFFSLVRNQKDLEWLHLNENQIKTFDGELPINNNKLILLNVTNNMLDHLPPELNYITSLRYFYCARNRLTGLNNTLSNLKNLIWLELTGNRIQEVCVQSTIYVNRPFIDSKCNIFHSWRITSSKTRPKLK